MTLYLMLLPQPHFQHVPAAQYFCYSVFSFVLYFKSLFLFIRLKWCWAWWQMWLKSQYCGCRGRWVSVNPRTARATEREPVSKQKEFHMAKYVLSKMKSAINQVLRISIKQICALACYLSVDMPIIAFPSKVETQ